MKEIFLQSNKSSFSNDVESQIDIDFSTKVRLLPINDLSKDFSLNKQYNKERDECERFRLILGINPICSNVLYNSKTEMVLKEGSDNVQRLRDFKDGIKKKYSVFSGATNTTSAITYIDALRNTEYSHPELGDLTYHCGYNIFNNHMLRNDDYVHVNRLDSNNTSGDVYNTIMDYARDKNGKIIQQDLNAIAGASEYINTHLYSFDSILTMRQAFIERCEEQDGWWGFINPTNLNISNREGDDTILINKLINNKNACDFIDLYPDRSLYSFIPKYNKYRNRLEKNWDYCITYPYENDYKKIDEVCGGENSVIRVNYIKKSNTAGVSILECHSYFNHNLQINDNIRLYYYDGNNGIQSFQTAISIASLGDGLGDNKEKIFSINFDNISSIERFIAKTESKSIYDGYFFFKRLSNGNECQYYFRKFKKLKTVNNEDIKSEINKIAFGKNIYGDDVAQIIFTDDININGLVDNNNRPLSKVYFTVIKRNSGHDLWYNSDDNSISSSTIEFSHCFGKITSGLDFSGMKEEPFDYNIHRMHNLDFNNKLEELLLQYEKFEIEKYEIEGTEIKLTYKYWNYGNEDGKTSALTLSNVRSDEIRTFLMWGDSVLKLPKTLNDTVDVDSSGITSSKNNKGITIEDDVFYGDVVEYDVANCVETIISKVYHRVNTAQREAFDVCYRDIIQDKIVHDDYDINVVKYIDSSGVEQTVKDFKVKSYYINDAIDSEVEWAPTDHSDNTGKTLVFGNIMPEGNYYNPHFQIDLKSEESNVLSATAKLINYDNVYYENELLIIDVPTNYGFYKGDYIAFYNSKINKTMWGVIVKTENDGYTLYISIDNLVYDEKDFIGTNRIYRAYWSPNNIPFYANLLPKTRKFVWRKLLGQSELSNSNPLYDMTFANGCLYIEKNINFFLRRQDPFGKYGLSRPILTRVTKQYSNPMDDYNISGTKQIDVTGIMYSNNNFDNCY